MHKLNFGLGMVMLTVLTIAGTKAKADRVHEHDGFFLRMAGGFGYSSVTETDVSVFGPSFGLQLAIGGAFNEAIRFRFRCRTRSQLDAWQRMVGGKRLGHWYRRDV